MSLELLSFAGSTLSFAVAISWNEVAHGVIRRLPGAGQAFLTSLAYAILVTLLAALAVEFAASRRRRLTVRSGFPVHRPAVHSAGPP